MRTVVGIHSGSRTRQACSHTEEPTPTIWCASWRQLASVPWDENRALLRMTHEKQPRTVLELAEFPARAASNLSRTLRNLEGYGLIKLHRSPEQAVRAEALATEFLVVLD